VARANHQTYDESVEAMLQRRYGWPLADAAPAGGVTYHRNEAPVDLTVFADIVERASAPDAPMKNTESYAVEQGVRQLLAKPALTPEDIGMLRKVMQLDNMRSFAGFPREVREWRPELVVLIPDAVARIEKPYAKDDRFAGNMFGFLAAAPRELVRPHAVRIDAVLKTQRGEKAAKLFRVLHEISPDPAAVLIPWTRIPDGDEIFISGLLEGALVGLCRTAQPGRQDIAQAFRDFLQTNFSHNTPHYQAWAAIAGLVHTSGAEEVRRVTAYPDEERRRNIERSFRIAMEKPWPASCARY
jgi:hypothetical protein